MATIQCKMCGGMVDLPTDVTCGECPYCGSLTTFPRQTDDRKCHLCNRAEHFRLLNDFDQARDTYEKILELDDADPDIHWGLLLARFGIEYVEDPRTHERIPTCHRIHRKSILDDPDCLAALELSTGSEHDFYETQAHKIARIQQQFLDISSHEKPYDIFICYKETSEAGTRTQDSVLAQDLYNQLVREGFKVFFSRITLEDKLGEQYEPYIFAALQSARVMLVVGTQKDHFEAVWVRNEWSRFLDLMQQDSSRLLIPCYRDMDPYDLPQALSMLQSQDMAKIGFMQDLVHGVRKVLQDAQQQESAADAPSTQNLLERVKHFLLAKDFENAREYCFRLLDREPHNADVFFLQFMAEMHMNTEEAVPSGTVPPEQLGSYQFIMKSENEELKKKLEHSKALYHQAPILSQALKLLTSIFKPVNWHDEQNLPRLFATANPANALCRTDDLCRTTDLLRQASAYGLAQKLHGHCSALLYDMASLLAQKDVQTCLFHHPDDFPQAYPELAELFQTEVELNNALYNIFQTLGTYRDILTMKQTVSKTIAPLKALQLQEARSTEDRLSIAASPYLGQIPQLKRTRDEILADAYDQALQCCRQKKWDEAKTMLEALAHLHFRDSQARLDQCNKAIEQEIARKKERRGCLEIIIAILAIIFGPIIIIYLLSKL